MNRRLKIIHKTSNRNVHEQEQNNDTNKINNLMSNNVDVDQIP